jgi:hypothetical protein
MREFRPLVRTSAAARRLRAATRRLRAATRRLPVVWLTLAALLSLSVSQPLHASGPLSLASASAEAAFALAANDLSSSHAAHDGELCSLCRATAQARLGVRVSAGIGDLAPHGACLLLPLPAPEIARSAPDLRDTQPRAPPALRHLSA